MGKKKGKEKSRDARSVSSAIKTTISSCIAASAVASSAAPVEFGIYPEGVLEKLVEDKTFSDAQAGVKRNIVFGTDAYKDEYPNCDIYSPITAKFLMRCPAPVKPRVEKSRDEQSSRTKKSAEVFTPFWLCGKMVNYLDDEIVSTQRRSDAECAENSSRVDHGGRRDGKAGAPRTPPVDWRSYVDARVLEITCGEAPFIVSRYDAASGELIPIEKRIGVLDRKLRMVNENAADEAEWLKWTVRAYESVYGYEFQGDSLAIARFNLLATFEDNLQVRWGRKPKYPELVKIANRIAWNFWQMDGLKGTATHRVGEQFLPGFEYCEKKPEAEQGELALWDLSTQGCRVAEAGGDHQARRGGGEARTSPSPDVDTRECVIFDWRKRKPVIYNEIGGTRVLTANNATPAKTGRARTPAAPQEPKGAKIMKFDYAIGNPPYQEETGGTCTSDKPIYHLFMDEAYKVADKVELITPARFLFNAGATPKAWNKQMLEDSHLKVLEHVQKSDQVFANTDIKGGVAVTYRDSAKEFGAIETFTSHSELNSILKKVEKASSGYLSDIISNRGLYRFSENAYKEQAEELRKTSDHRISTDAFKEMGKLFTEEKPNNGRTYFRILGNLKGKRVYRWFRLDYLVPIENLKKYKVILPKANGSGAIGEVLSTPMIGAPMLGFTETYISIGSFDRKGEAEACLKYVKTKFARTMLGVLKITQDNTRPVWRKVPLQDFTSASDIDWSKSVKEIDRQLYKKYKLTKKEIDFIEEKVKEME